MTRYVLATAIEQKYIVIKWYTYGIPKIILMWDT